jgi:hypothetical protein
LTKRFYDSSTRIIKKHLSVEQLLFYLVEFSRLRNCLGEKLDLGNLIKRERLILDLTLNTRDDNITTTEISVENDVKCVKGVRLSAID